MSSHASFEYVRKQAQQRHDAKADPALESGDCDSGGHEWTTSRITSGDMTLIKMRCKWCGKRREELE